MSPHPVITAVQIPPRPSVIVIDAQGAIVAAPEVAIATPHDLQEAMRAGAAVLVCRRRCGPACRGHVPTRPRLGQRIVIGRRGTPRAVYLVTKANIAGHIRLEREA